jgi:hypothetical protein
MGARGEAGMRNCLPTGTDIAAISSKITSKIQSSPPITAQYAHKASLLVHSANISSDRSWVGLGPKMSFSM